MGKKGGIILLAILGAALGFAQIQHDVVVINIGVPVRVHDGAKFVDSLGLSDFEVTEDGQARPIEAGYLIRGVVEAYRRLGRTVTVSRTTVLYKDYKFFEVKVKAEIVRGG